MVKKPLVALSLLFVVVILLYATDSQAMPNFARKYNADCTMCHTNIPQLNRTGYEFRAAGYRLPTEIGKDEKPFNLGDFFTARIQEQWVYTKKNPATGPDTTSDSLEFFEFTMYPLTGSWGKYFASITELSMAPGDVFEVENAFVRAVYGDDRGWFQARLGVMHPWEGFGGSDRPIGNVRPLFQKNSAVGSPFYLWNLDESALEAGYNFAKAGTFISARISNGIVWEDEAPNKVDPAQGGSGGLATSQKQGYDSRKNYQIFVNQFITDDSAVSLYWYKGLIVFPDPSVGAPTNTQDTFNRYAAYANFYVVPKMVNLVAGYEYGRDSLADSSVAGGANVGKSSGYFGEVDYHASSKLALAYRYDAFDPSDKVGNNKITANTLSANYYVTNGLQFIADYQMKDTEKTTGGDDKQNQLTARMIFIW